MPRDRKTRLELIDADGDFDVIVIGGGINGVGVFRDLALQGLRVLLVERNDFCSGCSAAPSRMIHGGLRYLENGELSLVRESLRERDGLLDTAPHMVQPLPTTVPITGVFSGMWNAVVGLFDGGGKPSNRGAVPIKLGLTLYDWLTRKRRRLPIHIFRNRVRTRDQWPALTSSIKFSATYYDAWISHPERLGIEVLADAEESAPMSVALNYATVEAADDGRLILRDREGGADRHVTARSIVNATGAWLDETLKGFSAVHAGAERIVSGTKGSHLILDNADLHAALGGHMLYFENADGRICITFPYLGKVLVGSTDIRVDKAQRVRCEDDERDYILDSLRLLFPEIGVDEAQIVYSFSGIRPLPHSHHVFTGRISRGHFTRVIPGSVPQICMVGGKWTTFRAFAEQTTDVVLTELGVQRRTSTSGLAIGGGRDFPAERDELVAAFRDRFGVSEARARHLVDHYGTLGANVQQHCAGYGGEAPLTEDGLYTRGEIDYLCRSEQIVHLTDVILRRTSLAITGAVDGATIEAVARIAGDAFHWTDERRDAEISDLVTDLVGYHGVPEARLTPEKDRRKECV